MLTNDNLNHLLSDYYYKLKRKIVYKDDKLVRLQTSKLHIHVQNVFPRFCMEIIMYEFE